ncbi:MAG: hypothetical protein ACOYM2_16145 [Rectinemataceae bacterium]
MANKPEIFEGMLRYTQDEDSCDETGVGSQTLEVRTHDAGAGKYLVIETQRWAMDSIDELVEVLRDAAKRLAVGEEATP